MEIGRRLSSNAVEMINLDDEDTLHLILFTMSIVEVFKGLYPDEYNMLIEDVIEEAASNDEDLRHIFNLYKHIFIVQEEAEREGEDS